ncbi:ribosomal protein S18-alanine N-acetyltransferase [Cutibacterium equinum]|uniref:[Ribosomal protein bS18]-alanine N-acetyltransferase n=1 Tax=Cutibacterium equinum TaxID=3016342 RepID=A0ABY7QYK2_9ACTN|nr:ribosomal protein S18-alanine N-acetyltransferase [Cutibacterium equinum]WCC79473.1 ribosomal protein S18-alanine N-acetyltransferase [Cutibacterium equinum]
MIRSASPADLDAIMAVEQASFDPSQQWSRTSWAEEISPADHRLTLVAGDDEIAAVATFHGFDVADLDRIMVTPVARGQGLAADLLSRGIDWARSRGCRTMMLEVRRDNAPAISLYQRFGFETISQRPNYYGGGVDALIMSVNLPATTIEENHV